MPARFALRSRFDLRQLSTIGYGDITAGNEYERAFAIVCMIAGAAIFSSIVGTLLHVSQARVSSAHRHPVSSPPAPQPAAVYIDRRHARPSLGPRALRV